jgi:putative FmdB family regulatory protein
MPTYDYGCTNCGHVVEVVHGVNEPGPTVCPECGGLLRKRMSAPAIHFRGTGWAKKDARQAIAARTGKGKSDSSDANDKGKGDSGHSASSASSDSGAKESSPSGGSSSTAGERGGKPSSTAAASTGGED